MIVTAIVTSFNHAEYLDQRMQSLLNQSYQPLEILVIDDCSSDNSLDVLEKYKIYPNVKVVALKENQGYATACNIGAEMATGDYIIFSECDDFCEVNQIETLISMFKISQHSLGVVYSSSNIVDEKGTYLTNDFFFREKRFKGHCFSDCIIESEDIQKYFAVACVIPNMSAALINKEFFIKAGGLSKQYKLCADWDLWCKMSRICNFYYIRQPLNNFRTHSNTVRSRSKIDELAVEIMSLIYDHSGKMQRNYRSRIRNLSVVGNVLTNSITLSPFLWMEAFPKLYAISIAHDKLNAIAPIVGIAEKMIRILRL